MGTTPLHRCNVACSQSGSYLLFSHAEGVYDYANAVRRQLRAAGFHADVDLADRKMQKKVSWVGVRGFDGR